jgi:hypothetical protein
MKEKYIYMDSYYLNDVINGTKQVNFIALGIIGDCMSKIHQIMDLKRRELAK